MSHDHSGHSHDHDDHGHTHAHGACELLAKAFRHRDRTQISAFVIIEALYGFDEQFRIAAG